MGMRQLSIWSSATKSRTSLRSSSFCFRDWTSWSLVSRRRSDKNRGARRPLRGIKKDLFSQHLVHKLYNHGSFAHCRGDTFHALSPDVANRENSGKARLKQIRGPVERPAVSNLCTGLNESLCVERETTSKPFRVGIGAGHHEYMLDVAGFVRSSFGVVQPNPLKVSVAFKRFDCGPSHKSNARVRFDSGNQVSRHGFSEAWSSHHEINMLGGGG